MSILQDLSYGFDVIFRWQTLAFCFVGVSFGTLVGALPGISALAAISILLPITFYMDPTDALVMLAGIYYGSQYGNSISAILINIPGTPSAAVTCLDGYPLARSGRAGVALCMAAIASFFGACFAIILMMFFAPLLARAAVSFGAPEYFSMMLLGLFAASVIAEGSPLRGVAMVVLGLLLGVVGMDVQTGFYRFTFGTMELFDGISLVAMAMGTLGISEIINQAGVPPADRHVLERKLPWRSLLPTRHDFRISFLPALRASAFGAGFGILPGTGAAVASFFAYAFEKRISKTPERFGHGAIEGVAAPEAANNAAAQASFIPTLTLGIPGDAVVALLLGAMIIHGIAPGPRLIIDHPDIFWGLIASFWIGNLMLLVLNIPLVGIWVKMLTIPYTLLYPAILLFACLGVYSVRNNPFDLLVLLGASVVGYLGLVCRLPLAPLLLGFILGPLLEANMRRSLIISGGDLTVFVTRPISAAFIIIIVLITALMLMSGVRRRIQTAAASG